MLITYQKDTVWYRRDIKGERAVAEGIVFPKFANNNEPYLYDEEKDPLVARDAYSKLIHKPFKVTMGIDFGGN